MFLPWTWSPPSPKAIEDRPGPQAPLTRTPYFCAGCPHSSSTHLPEGSRGLAGIGCHFLAQFMDRNVDGFTQMGGEGAKAIALVTDEPDKEANGVAGCGANGSGNRARELRPFDADHGLAGTGAACPRCRLQHRHHWRCGECRKGRNAIWRSSTARSGP